MKKHFFSTMMLIFISISIFAQINKAAVISIWGNKDLTGKPDETKFYIEREDNNAMDIRHLADEFEKKLFDEILPKFSFPFLTKEEVVGVEGYKDIEELSTYKVGLHDVHPAEGYVPLAFFALPGLQDDKAIVKSFENLPDDVDGVMIAYLDIGITNPDETGTYLVKHVQGKCYIKIYDRNAKQIFKFKTVGKQSKENVEYKNGVIKNAYGLPLMIEDAYNDLFLKVEKGLPKKIEKWEESSAKEK